MIKLLVIADDFTGALDTGVQFSKGGIKTLVTTKIDVEYDKLAPDVQVLVIDVESRHQSADVAHERVLAATKAAKEAGVSYFFKKTDSTMRGNIGAELYAMAKGANAPMMYVPAFPKSGRTTVDGVQYVAGVPVAETIFAKDPFTPVTNSNILNIIGQTTTAQAFSVPKRGLYSTKAGEINVFDGESDDDLLDIARRIKESGHLNVVGGCAGFGESVEKMLRLNKEELRLSIADNSLLIVCGSVNEVSLKQIQKGGEMGIETHTQTPQEKLGLSDNLATINTLADTLKREKRLIIRAISKQSEMGLVDEFAAENGISLNKLHLKIAKNTGKMVGEIMKKAPVSTMVVFGGDTLLGIMEEIGGSGIIPIAEITPGVVISKVLCDSYDFNIVTKAGGFGGDDVIKNIVDFIESRV